MEHFITGEGDEARHRISSVAHRQVCKCNLYKALNWTEWSAVHNEMNKYISLIG